MQICFEVGTGGEREGKNFNLKTVALKMAPAKARFSQGQNLALTGLFVPNSSVQDFHLTQSVLKVVMQKSTRPQIRQLILALVNYY